MASTVIPSVSETLPLKPALHALKNSQIIRPSRSSTPSSDVAPRRALSAQSINAGSNLYYSRCIEYLQEQHKITLEKLHKEVHDLKQENKKLNFKILLENDGGAMSIVKKHLPKVSNKNAEEELILKEAIKDLQVKLNIANDNSNHLKNTVKNLTKQLSLFKRGAQVPERSTQSLNSIAQEQAHLKLIQHLRQQNIQQAKELEEIKLELKISNDKIILQKSFDSNCQLGDAKLNVVEMSNPRQTPRAGVPEPSPEHSNSVSKRPSFTTRKDGFLPPLNIKSAQGMRFRPDGRFKKSKF